MQTTQRPKDVFWPDHPSGFLIIGSQNPTDRLMTILQYGYLIQFPTANMQIRSIHSQRPQAQVAGMSEYPTSDHGTQKHVYRWFCLSQQVPPGGRLLRQLVWLLCQLCCLGPIGAAGLCLAAIVLGNRFWKYQLSTKIAPLNPLSHQHFPYSIGRTTTSSRKSRTFSLRAWSLADRAASGWGLRGSCNGPKTCVRSRWW